MELYKNDEKNLAQLLNFISEKEKKKTEKIHMSLLTYIRWKEFNFHLGVYFLWDEYL